MKDGTLNEQVAEVSERIAALVQSVKELAVDVAAYQAAATTTEREALERAWAARPPEPEPLTLEDVKAAIIAAQKRTKTPLVQKAVMDRGGSAVDESGTFRPSLKALPRTKYAETIAALEALPTTGGRASR